MILWRPQRSHIYMSVGQYKQILVASDGYIGDDLYSYRMEYTDERVRTFMHRACHPRNSSSSSYLEN